MIARHGVGVSPLREVRASARAPAWGCTGGRVPVQLGWFAGSDCRLTHNDGWCERERRVLPECECVCARARVGTDGARTGAGAAPWRGRPPLRFAVPAGGLSLWRGDTRDRGKGLHWVMGLGGQPPLQN